MGGVVLVVWGWAIVGMLVETYGFWVLFAGFVPTALSFLRRVPVLGRVLDLPGFKRVGCAHAHGPHAQKSWAPEPGLAITLRRPCCDPCVTACPTGAELRCTSTDPSHLRVEFCERLRDEEPV